jgi:hypothetical protein
MARQHCPKLGVLFTSGYTENVVARRDGAGAPIDLLPKPYMRKELAQRIRAALDRRKT